MTTALPRQRCERCRRPASHCLCPHIPSVPNRTHVLILQHPEESRHPLNTARLAQLGLQHAELWVGDHFPNLEARLSGETACLLFPPDPGAHAAAPSPPQSTSLLVVPDGTWRQVRKLLLSNPALTKLPRLSLKSGTPSTYRIRKAREPAAVSTIEAIVRGLSRLEPEQDFQSLLAPFNALVEQQILAIGPERYQRNYGNPE